MQVLQQGATEEKGENARLVRLLLRVLPREVAGLVDWHGSIETLYLFAPSQASPASSVLSTDARCSAAGSLCRRNGHCRHGEDHARPQGHGAGTSLVGLQGTELVAALVASRQTSPPLCIVEQGHLRQGALQDKILQSMGRGHEVVVTNDGATILKSLYVDNPAAKVLVGASTAQLCRHTGVLYTARMDLLATQDLDFAAWLLCTYHYLTLTLCEAHQLYDATVYLKRGLAAMGVRAREACVQCFVRARRHQQGAGCGGGGWHHVRGGAGGRAAAGG